MKFFDIILHPQETMAGELVHANMQEANRTFAIYGAVMGLLIGIVITGISFVLGATAATMVNSVPLLGIVAGVGFAAIIIMPIISAILTLVFSHIGFHIMHIVATLLGGKGTFQNNYYLGSKLLWPVLVANILIFILSLIPILGMLVNIIWFFYYIFIMIVLVSVANNISRLRALVVILLPGILFTVLIATAALVVLVNPTTIQGNQCDSKFVPFVVSQSQISDTTSQFVFVNQSGQSVKFNLFSISGTSGDGKPFSWTADYADTMNINQTKTISITHPPLGEGAYMLSYSFNYDAGNLAGLTSVGTCRGTI